jgi:hypothetical protein
VRFDGGQRPWGGYLRPRQHPDLRLHLRGEQVRRALFFGWNVNVLGRYASVVLVTSPA